MDSGASSSAGDVPDGAPLRRRAAIGPASDTDAAPDHVSCSPKAGLWLPPGTGQHLPAWPEGKAGLGMS